jgi:hypothetical protein
VTVYNLNQASAGERRIAACPDVVIVDFGNVTIGHRAAGIAVKSFAAAPATPGSIAAAKIIRIIMSRKASPNRVEPEPSQTGEMLWRQAWSKRLVSAVPTTPISR